MAGAAGDEAAAAAAAAGCEVVGAGAGAGAGVATAGAAGVTPPLGLAAAAAAQLPCDFRAAGGTYAFGFRATPEYLHNVSASPVSQW